MQELCSFPHESIYSDIGFSYEVFILMKLGRFEKWLHKL